MFFTSNCVLSDGIKSSFLSGGAERLIWGVTNRLPKHVIGNRETFLPQGVDQASLLSSLTWIHCPGHAGDKGIEKAVKLSGPASVHFAVRVDNEETARETSDRLRMEDDMRLSNNNHIRRMDDRTG